MRMVALLAVVLAVGWMAYRLVVLQPSNDRDWEYGMATLPSITISGDTIAVRHERDFRWTTDGPSSSEYVDTSFNLQRLVRVWFVEEPFTIAPFDWFDGVAHTYFVFDFEDQPPVAVSVEARRVRGQGYDAIRGLFNEYELISVWGTEQDVTGRRAVLERNQLYMYPVVGSLDSGRQLFRHMAEMTQQLESHPRFYNTLTSNCTNELAKVANEAQPGAIPPNIGLIFPGYAAQELYTLGFVPNDAPFEVIRERYAISATVQAVIEQPEFSELLRTRLGAPQAERSRNA